MSVLFFLLGTIAASFCCCMIDRRLASESPRGRSHCDSCGQQLKVGDLIPVLIFLLLRGRCRYCSQKISGRLFVCETVNGLTWTLLWLRYGPCVLLWRYLTLFTLLLAISYSDSLSFTVPDSLLVILIIARIVLFQSSDRLPVIFLQAFYLPVFLLAFCFLFCLIRKKQPMGLGDIKLFYVLGCYFSWEKMILLLFLSCLIGIIYCLLSPIKGRSRPFPFVPSIYLAALLTLFFGQQIIAFYLFRFAKLLQARHFLFLKHPVLSALQTVKGK